MFFSILIHGVLSLSWVKLQYFENPQLRKGGIIPTLCLQQAVNAELTLCKCSARMASVVKVSYEHRDRQRELCRNAIERQVSSVATRWSLKVHHDMPFSATKYQDLLAISRRSGNLNNSVLNRGFSSTSRESPNSFAYHNLHNNLPLILLIWPGNVRWS